MKFRAGLLIGMVIGFVLGARAGKERYDKMVRSIQRILGSEQVQQASDIAERSTRSTRAAAGRGLVTVADQVRDRAASN